MKTPTLRVHRAEGFAERLLGLLARPRLLPGEALALAPCAAVHTCFMPYAIDLLYLDAQDRVIKRVDALAPWRASACPGARCTLELAAGEAARLGLGRGSLIDWRRSGPAPTPLPSNTRDSESSL